MGNKYLAAIILGLTLPVIATGCKKSETTLPVVAVQPAAQDDVEIYGEYVGRVRAQQFVEVRARVEGYLEKMLFEEGTYVKKNQVLFIINPDQYRAKVDKATGFLPVCARSSYQNARGRQVFSASNSLFQNEHLREEFD